MTVQPKVSGIRERDIDLLLCEELVASPEFLSWYLEEAGVGHRGSLAAAARSVVSASGESDLWEDFGSGTMDIVGLNARQTAALQREPFEQIRMQYEIRDKLLELGEMAERSGLLGSAGEVFELTPLQLIRVSAKLLGGWPTMPGRVPAAEEVFQNDCR